MTGNRVLFTSGMIMLSAALALAGDGIETSLNAGLTLTDGNSRTRQAAVAVTTEGERARLGSFRAGAVVNYGESKIDGERETTLGNAKLFGNVRKTITPRTYGALDASALYDDIALIDYRVIVGPSLGAYLVKTDDTALSFDLGLAYLWEDVDAVHDDYLALRLAQRLEHAMSETAKVWQSTEYIPKAADFNDYLLAAEVGAEAAMNARLSLRVVLQSQYDATPAAGLKHTDLTLVSGLRIAL